MNPATTTISAADTAWLLISTAMVMLMTPGLALFYGGMVQKKNVLSTFMHSFFALGLISVQWSLFGYSLAFGTSHAGLIGGLDYIGLRGVGMEAKGTVPHLAYMAYQMMFAVITPALISGAYAERLKFSAYCLFTVLWATLVYDPVAHWVWGGGWLGAAHSLDFAGGTVVHLSSGVTALVVALVLKPRARYPHERRPPHNLTMTVLGAGLLWFGWFGFNGGSASGANGQAAQALVTTHLAAAAGALAWGLIEALRVGKVTMLGVASGLVAGLVGITPAAGYVGPMAALAIGAAAGLVCFGAVMLKHRFGYDDALDAFGVHGVGGALGALLTGVFVSTAWNSPVEGAIHGNWSALVPQLLGVGATIAYSALVSFGLLKLIDVTVGLRVDEEDEHEGLDIVTHGESGYEMGDNAAGGHYAEAEREREDDAPAAAPAATRAAV